MYARSTTFEGPPSNVEAGIAFLRNEAWPLLETIEGCAGLSMLVDAASGRCIATSSWTSRDALRASEQQLRPIRERGRDILGGSMQVDDWEIAAMHRSGHGECCRVTWLQGDLDAMTDSFRDALESYQQTPGLTSASLMVDPASGTGCATTAWATRAARDDGRPADEDLQGRVARDGGGVVADAREFDIAFAHLHVAQGARSLTLGPIQP
jgi:quinol monooxygenase YgiN